MRGQSFFVFFHFFRKIEEKYPDFYVRGEAAPMALHGAKGEILFQKRTSPFGTPKRKAGGVSIFPPAPPNGQKGEASPLLFGLSSPLF